MSTVTAAPVTRVLSRETRSMSGSPSMRRVGEGVKSASVELGEAYVGGLRGFRQRRRQAAGGERALDRRVLEYEVQRLLELRKEADDASLTDSLAYAHLSKGMRRALPKVGTRTRSPRARGDDHA